MRVCSIVGARPQFIKAASVSRAIRASGLDEVLVHTGQHYSANMSEAFFEELGIPAPDYNLGIGSGTHARQTGAMLVEIETCLEEENPDLVLVFGDTNSTLAGGLAAAKLGVPVAHVEAGLRSFNRSMPEEINRVLVDHLSSVLLCPSSAAINNLAAEGVIENVHLIGDVMLDVLQTNLEATNTKAVLSEFSLEEQGFVLATIHRAGNTDSEDRLRGILAGLEEITRSGLQVIFPVHPRTAERIKALPFQPENILVVDPLPYRTLIGLQGSAKAVITDSGGMQKEAYWLGTPCITVRDETEWIETVEVGWNRLCEADPAEISRAVTELKVPEVRPELYGDGRAGQRVAAAIEAFLARPKGDAK